MRLLTRHLSHVSNVPAHVQFFSGLLGGVTAIFAVMTQFYHYVDSGEEGGNEQNEDGDASTTPLISGSVEG